MKSHREDKFTVVCLRCGWEEDHDTQQDARTAADTHQRENVAHVMHVFPPEQGRRAA